MAKINPIYVDGSPMCSGAYNAPTIADNPSDCPLWPKTKEAMQSAELMNNICWSIDDECIPGLRRDRDKAIARIKEHVAFISILKNRLVRVNDQVGVAKIQDHLRSTTEEYLPREQELQREICELTKTLAEDDGVSLLTVEDIAKQRGWDCFEGGE